MSQVGRMIGMRDAAYDGSLPPSPLRLGFSTVRLIEAGTDSPARLRIP